MPQEILVIAHGLWMGSAMLGLQRHRLGKLDLPTYSFSYPSVRGDLSSNSRRLADFCEKLPSDKIHLVGHSLGGLVILAMLQQFPDIPVGRIVLLGAPVAGNRVAQELAKRRVLKAALGLSIGQWLAEQPQNYLFDYEIGVIAGRKSIGAGRLFVRIPRPNDGIVTVAETKYANAKDSIILNVSHSGMLFSREVTAQIAAFLKTGSFSHQ